MRIDKKDSRLDPSCFYLVVTENPLLIMIIIIIISIIIVRVSLLKSWIRNVSFWEFSKKKFWEARPVRRKEPICTACE